LADVENRIGQVTGLAWTQVRGELLTLEAASFDGKGKIIKTGSLGDVMQESIQAALSVVRSRAESLGIDLTTDKAACMDSCITSPNDPVFIIFPFPSKLAASNVSSSPRTWVHAKPVT
jgi:hypothetical protein